MIIQENFEVLGANVAFRFKVKSDLTLIVGDSGVGKTLFYSSTKGQYNVLQDFEKNKNEMLFLNREVLYYLNSTMNRDEERAKSSLCETLKRMTNTICIIDEADYILNDEAIEYINSDKDNQYIIFSRDTKRFNVSYNNIAEIVSEDDGELVLFYPYMVGGEQCG